MNRPVTDLEIGIQRLDNVRANKPQKALRMFIAYGDEIEPTTVTAYSIEGAFDAVMYDYGCLGLPTQKENDNYGIILDDEQGDIKVMSIALVSEKQLVTDILEAYLFKLSPKDLGDIAGALIADPMEAKRLILKNYDVKTLEAA